MKRSILIATIAVGLLLSYACLAEVIDDYDEKMSAALSLRHADNSEEAEKIYSGIIAVNSNDVDALVGRGFCRIRTASTFNEAEADFQAVIELAPSYIDAYYGLALIYKRSGRWNEAKAILGLAAERCSGDEAIQYLADICWRVGHLPLARSIDLRPLAQSTRKVKGYREELYLSYTYDWVEDRPDWYQGGAVFIHHPRPDLNVGVSFFKYRRNEEYDEQLGFGASYRHDMNLSFDYQSFFSLDKNFLAYQKHHPSFSYSLPSSTVVGAGLRLDEYDNGWARVGRFNMRQYMRAFYAEYSILTGYDNLDRSVTTHIARLGYEGDGILSGYLGYSSGAETLEQAGGSGFSDQLVESLFVSLKYFVSPRYSIILSYGPEYRDSELFRTTGAVSVGVRF